MTDDRGRRILGAGGLYLVVTRPRIPHEELVAAAVARGVPIVQLREKDLPDDELLDLARALRRVTAGTSTLLIINDRPDVAAAVRADGVHVGRTDADPAAARRIVGAGIVGLSANAREELATAVRAGADYVGVGPVFPTATKPDAREPIGLEGLRELGALCPTLPVVAIGGLDRTTAPGAIEAGAAFVAVVSAVCRADDPIAALDDLLAAIAVARGTGARG